MRREILAVRSINDHAAGALVHLHAYAVDIDLMQPPSAARRHGGGNGDAGADEGNGLARSRKIEMQQYSKLVSIFV